MGALSDRQYQSARRVRPGRVVTDERLGTKHAEEYATAVVGPDGETLGRTQEELMDELIHQVKRLVLAMEMAFDMEVPEEIS